MKKREFLSIFLSLTLMMGLVPAAAAEEDPLAGLDITWVETDNVLEPLGFDNLVGERKVVRYGERLREYVDYGLRSADGVLLEPVAYGTTLPGGPYYGIFAVGVETRADGSTVHIDHLGRTYENKPPYPAWEPDELEMWRQPSLDGNDKWGYADPVTGEVVVPGRYDEVGPFTDGVGIAGIGGVYFAIDREGNKLFDYPYDAFRGLHTRSTEGLRWVIDKETEKVGFIDAMGNVTIPLEWQGASEFSEGLARVAQNDKYGYIDHAGVLAIPCVLDEASDMVGGVAAITYNGKQGILKNPLLKNKTSAWAAEEVKAATEAGYVTPSCATYQTFTITRAQFAELAVNYLEKATGETIVPAPMDTFTDTADETVRKACAAGIVQGMGDGAFSPGSPLTREQLATMLWRAMEKVGAGMSWGGMDQYVDFDQVSDWAVGAMESLVNHRVMSGTSATTLSPKASCTVEQAILLVYRAAAKKFTLPEEREAQHQAALNRAAIENIEIGAPFENLPQDLREELKPEGEPYDSGVFNPGEEIGRRYVAPGIEVITSTATEKVLKRVLENQDKDYLLKYYGSEDWQEVYEREKGREYVDTVILTGDNYRMVSGLKVGDSGARVRELGYPLQGETYGETVGFDGAVTVYMGNDVVERIEVYDCLGRRIGAFYDP